MVVKIAQAIYGELAFDRMSILADALDDAGCDNADEKEHEIEPLAFVVQASRLHGFAPRTA